MTDPYLELQTLTKLPKPLPRVPLATWPTPVRRLEKLGKRLGLELWIKCDHEATPTYGGNKLRKLELLLAEAKRQGSKSVLTVGGLGSHQVTAVALFAKAIDAVPAAIVYPRPLTPWVRANAAIWERSSIRLFPVGAAEDWQRGMDVANAELPEPVYLMSTGGSSPTGNLGFVAAAVELAAQLTNGDAPPPDEIAIACGSGGTVAGLMLGLALAKRQATRIIAVRCGSEDICTEATVRRQVEAVTKHLARLGARLPTFELPALELVDSGVAYGVLTPEIGEMIALAKDDEGLELDPTYTAHVLANVRERGGRGSRRVLFWQTNNPLSVSDFEHAPIPKVLEPWLV